MREACASFGWRLQPLRHRLFRLSLFAKNGRASRYADWYQVTRWHPTAHSTTPVGTAPASCPISGATKPTSIPALKIYFRHHPPLDGPIRPGTPRRRHRRLAAGCGLLRAPCLWREWHAHVRAINPNAYTTAEMSAPLRMAPARRVRRRHELRMDLPTLSFFTPAPHAIPAREFRQRINTLHARHAPGTIHILQNLLDSHDTGRC